MERYLSREDLSLRLDGTMCMYGDEPCQVCVDPDQVGDEIKIKYLTKDARWRTIEYTEDKFTPHGIELGYINYAGMAYYITRQPVRRNQQGLNFQNIHVSDGGSTSILFTVQTRDCIKNIYPSLRKSYDNVSAGSDLSCAFHRDFCIYHLEKALKSLKYKNRTVGFIGKNYEIQLVDGPDASFIRRILHREGF